MAFVPHLLVQTSEGHRVTEQRQALAIVEAGRADFQRVANTFLTQVLDRLRLTVTRGRQGAGQGVLLRVDHRTHKPVIEGVPTVFVGVLLGRQQGLRRIVFLGDQEQALVAGLEAQLDPAGDHRHRNRQHQRTHDRDQPPQEAWVQPHHQQRPQEAKQGLWTVALDRLAPWRGVVVTLRRVPGRSPAEERGEHETGVEDHPHRGQQHGEQHLQQHRQGHLELAAELFRALGPDQDDAQQFRQEQQHNGGGEQRHRLVRMPLRPQRVQLAWRHEVLRFHQGVHRQQRCRQHQEEEPQRCRQVRHHAGQEHRTVYRVHAFYQEQAEVHQVTVAPATVTLEFVQQVRRQLFIAARQVVGNPHAPAGTAHQRCFNEVVGQNRTGKRPFTRQRREGAVLDKWLHADDGVVAPVVRFTQLPEVQASRKQRAIDAGSELLHARIQGVHARRPWRGLDNPGIRRGFHQAHQAGQAFAAHHAVGVEDHHVLVFTAPTTAEVVKVAALALHATATTAIEDLAETTGFAAHIKPGLLFGDADIGFVTVAEDEEIKAIQVTGGGYRLKRRTQTGKYPGHVFVADRHHQRGAGIFRNRLVAGTFTGDPVFIVTGEQFEEAHQRGPETGRNPAEQDPEHDQDAGLQGVRQYLGGGLQQGLIANLVEVDQRPALVRHDAFHVPAGNDGLAEHQHQQDIATDRTHGTPASRWQYTLVLRRCRRVGATGHPAPAAHQDVGTPRLGHHFGPTDRRRGLQADTATGIECQHFCILQLFSRVEGQPTANRRLGSVGWCVEGCGRQTLVQLAEGSAARQFGALLCSHREVRQVLGERLGRGLRITHRQATDSSRSRSGHVLSWPDLG